MRYITSVRAVGFGVRALLPLIRVFNDDDFLRYWNCNTSLPALRLRANFFNHLNAKRARLARRERA